jgi:hypothetical protein
VVRRATDHAFAKGSGRLVDDHVWPGFVSWHVTHLLKEVRHPNDIDISSNREAL